MSKINAPPSRTERKNYIKTPSHAARGSSAFSESLCCPQTGRIRESCMRADRSCGAAWRCRPEPPKSGSGAASDGKAVLSWWLHDSRMRPHRPYEM